MVALQILVLSVWVRVLVEQQKETVDENRSLFFVVSIYGREPTLIPGPPQILICAGEEVPRMALRVLLATHRTSQLIRVTPLKTEF